MLKLPALCFALTGCFIIEPDPVPCSNHCVPPEEVVDVMTVSSNLDLLFVIDDSPTMIDKQVAFRTAFPAMVDKLAGIEGGMPNLHLAVISSDMGTSAVGDDQAGASIGQVGQGGCVRTGKGGAFQLGQATLLESDDTFVKIGRDGSKNFEGELAPLFGQMSALGAGGCGFEQPLAASRAALSGSVEANAGFLRPGANLAVIVLSDEDDCSAEHTTLFGPDGGPMGALQSFRCFRFGVQCDQDTDTLGTKTNCRPAAATHVANPDTFSNAMLATKGDPRRVMFGGVVGTSGPVEVVSRAQPGGGAEVPAVAAACKFTPSGGGAEITADPGIRFAALANEFPGISKLESICAENLAPAAASLGDSIAAMMTDTCLPNRADESSCFVDDFRDGDPQFQDTLAPCSQAQGVGANCFSFVSDTRCASGQRLSIARPIPPIGDEFSTLRCRE